MSWKPISALCYHTITCMRNVQAQWHANQPVQRILIEHIAHSKFADTPRWINYSMLFNKLAAATTFSLNPHAAGGYSTNTKLCNNQKGNDWNPGTWLLIWMCLWNDWNPGTWFLIWECLGNDWNPGTWLLIWECLARGIQWLREWHVLDGFQKSCTFNENTLIIRKVNKLLFVHLLQ